MLYNHTRSPQNLLGEGVSRPLLAITTVEKPLSAALVRRTGQCHLELTLLELSAGSLNACVIAKIICLLKIAHYSSTAQEITKFLLPLLSERWLLTLQVITINTWKSGVGQSPPGAERVLLIPVYLTASERLLTGLTETFIFLLTWSFKRLCCLGF